MIRRALSSLLLCLVLLCAGIYLGAHPDGLPGVLRDPLVGDGQTRVVNEAIQDVHDTYYRAIPRAQLADQSIKGIVASLNDRFSNYFTPTEYARFKQQESGQFAGVGITVDQNPLGLEIFQVFDNSPASRAHLAVGDTIVAVDGRSLKGLPKDRSVAMITGKIGTDVRLRVRHGARVRDVTLTRATIDVPLVGAKDRTYKGRRFAIIHLDQFASGVHGQLGDALHKALRHGDEGIVLDLRGNPGGLVTEAQLVASEFLSDGRIVTTKGRSVPARTLSATGDPVAPRTPLVVLVDHNSASAAEIVAGALQDRHRAKLVGTNTFGKGVFQQVIELSNGGALDITAGQYFTPSGRNLGGPGTSTGSGLKPDVWAQDDPKTPHKDEALDAALATLARSA
jgi:carboxyl-terminal processing protease